MPKPTIFEALEAEHYHLWKKNALEPPREPDKYSPRKVGDAEQHSRSGNKRERQLGNAEADDQKKRIEGFDDAMKKSCPNATP